MPKAIPGHVVPGPSDPFIKVRKPGRGWVTYRLQFNHLTDTPYGPPIKPEPVFQPAPVKPKAIGDESHHAVMHALSALVAQHTTQITDALPGDRLWR